jgi:hypothetical protein
MNIKTLVYSFPFFLFAVCINYTNCTYKNEHQINPLQDCSGLMPDTVSFSKNIIPLITTNCAIPTCHSGSKPAGSLDLDGSVAYSQLGKSGSGYIDTLNPTYSVLYSSLVSSSTPMPPNGSLSTCNLQLIQKWMKQGGKNN